MSSGGGWGRSGGSGGGNRRGPQHRRPQQGGNPWDKSQNSRSSDEPDLVVPEPYMNGRHLAYAVLQEYDRSERFVQDIFAEFDQRHHLSSQDRALAVDVASGVVRRSRTLDVMSESQQHPATDNPVTLSLALTADPRLVGTASGWSSAISLAIAAAGTQLATVAYGADASWLFAIGGAYALLCLICAVPMMRGSKTPPVPAA